jgi:signal transduction histidine kinase
MAKPWQIWTVYFAILLLTGTALAWLSVQINEADRLREEDRLETELARREAELQDRVNSALYRMDWWATPLIAQESSRPYYWYLPFYSADLEPGRGEVIKRAEGEANRKIPSPLLTTKSEFVTMHFQISSDNQATSPQVPAGESFEMAIQCGLSAAAIDEKRHLFAKALDFCNYPTVVGCCPGPGSNWNSGGDDVSFQTLYRDPAFNETLLESTTSNKQILEQESDPQYANNPKLWQQMNRSVGRGNAEFAQRAANAENFGQSQQQTLMTDTDIKTANDDLVNVSVMRPVWIKDQLILARRVEGANFKTVQCCWLDWPKIREKLSREIMDVVPVATFEPVKEAKDLEFGRVMATLPVKLEVDLQEMLPQLTLPSPPELQRPSGLRSSLFLAWIGFGIAAIASGLLLRGVLQLSERRAAFVSAVTHELRTPLTTFRMYAEMLAERMVPVDKQTEYAETMKSEADRLASLVENVLQFARLEQGNGACQREATTPAALIDRFQQRFRGRCEEVGMQLIVDLGNAANVGLAVETTKVEQILFNLVDNACKYARESSDKRIVLSVRQVGRYLQFAVQDFGPGVSPKFRRRLFQPFCKSDQDSADTAAGVGLGLTLCQRMAKSLGGRVFLAESPAGSRFVLELRV